MWACYPPYQFLVLNASSIIADKTKENGNSRTSAMLLFDILKKILVSLKLYIFSLFIILGP
jgi:hypothetical protein